MVRAMLSGSLRRRGVTMMFSFGEGSRRNGSPVTGFVRSGW